MKKLKVFICCFVLPLVTACSNGNADQASCELGPSHSRFLQESDLSATRAPGEDWETRAQLDIHAQL